MSDQKLPLLGIQRTSTLNAINFIGKSLNAVGIDPFKLDPGRLIAKARKKADYHGPVSPNLEEGIRRMIHSIQTEARPNPFGNIAVKALLERTLYGRFMVEKHLEAHPEIEEIEIREPVFIIGMPRTGTTILHAMMHEDPGHRSPLAWECLIPYPLPRPEAHSDNPQINQIRKEFQQLFKLVPDFLTKHYMAADSPQECLGINALNFTTFQIAAQLYVPSYLDWFANEADQLETMRFHKRFLQFLTSGGVRADRWLLKSPVHLMRLPEIFAVYPHAKIIMPHRTPLKVVASAASLVSSVRTLYSDYEDSIRTGHEQAGIWSQYFERFLSSRRSLNKEDQILDIRFEDFVKDQVGTVEKIYDHFGWPLGEDTLGRFRSFLAQNPKDKHGVHEYPLEKFGLTEAGIQSQFSHYLQFLTQL